MDIGPMDQYYFAPVTGPLPLPGTIILNGEPGFLTHPPVPGKGIFAFNIIAYGRTDLDNLHAELMATLERFTGVAATPVANEDGKAEKIEELRTENDRQTDLPARLYSRSCEICIVDQPVARVVLVACGHTLCMACALQIEKHGRVNCPFCRKLSAFVKLREEVVEEKETKKNEKKEVEKNKDKKDDEVKNKPAPYSSNNSNHSIATNRCVFVGNLPYQTKEHDFQCLMSRVGHVTSIRLVTVRDTGRFKGFGFCTFSDEFAARKSVDQLNGSYFYGRKLRVDMKSDRVAF